MSIDFFELFKETVLISIAKRKIAEGVELTEEEKDKILQQIYSAARKEIKDGKELRNKYFISTEDGRIIRVINDNIIVKTN